MKLFTTRQISQIDKYTMEHEPVSSIDLMERAANQLCNYILSHYQTSQAFVFVCGFGNNGGDGLAMARILHQKGYKIRVYLFAEENKQSPDNLINHKRCSEISGLTVIQSTDMADYSFSPNEIIVDALFGSGLNRPLEGVVVPLIQKINSSGNFIISIDIPSGLMGEDNRQNNIDSKIKANVTLTLEFPKLSFFFPENEQYVGRFELIPIFLHKKIKADEPSPYYLSDKTFISSLIKKRAKFAEKRDFGHGLLIAGSYGKMGAAILASKACLRTGIGLITTHIPKSAVTILQTAIPEAMLSIDEHEFESSQISNPEKYTAVAIGPGIGCTENTQHVLNSLLQKNKNPLIIDADGLNLLAQQTHLLSKLPENTILTPHVREFDRLFGNHDSHYARFLTATIMAKEYQIMLVLKGAYTQIYMPTGEVYFNQSGTPGMATAGSGDVLTGIILSLLAQNYSPQNAAVIGVFLHGLAGELALENQSEESLIASDIIENIGKAFKCCY
jgi:NAD(P)H-hydrate epimerase